MKLWSMETMWAHAVQSCFGDGSTLLDSRAGKCSELVGYKSELANVNENFLLSPIRNASAVYACAELLWYLRETNKLDMIVAYAPSYSRFGSPDGTAHGHYGHRWRWGDDWGRYYEGRWQSALDCVMDVIRKQPNTRQAVLLIWRSGDLVVAHDGKCPDIPCTLGLKFYPRDAKLQCIADMRSNDVWLGFPYDVFCFSSVQKIIADHTGLDYGDYHHQSGSMHAYEQHWEKLGPAKSAPLTEASSESIKRPDMARPKFGYRSSLNLALEFERDSRSGEHKLATCCLDDVHYVLRDAALVCASRWAPDIEKALKLLDSVKQLALKARASQEAIKRFKC